MNFYTSTYDLNNPTTTQVNVPTNTSYRVGLKFKRNGEIQNLQTTEVTVGNQAIDAEKTNGYITYTTESGDEPSFQQFNVVVDTRVPGDKKVVDYIVQMTDNTIPRALSASVDEEGLVGQYYGEDGQLEMYLWNSASQPPEDYTQWTKMTPAGSGTKVVKCADGSLWYWRNLPEPMVIEGKTYDTGYWFLHTNTAGNVWVEGAKSILLQSGDYLISGTYRYTANNWLGIVTCVKIPPTGYTQTVKLNVNVVKSQKGDLNPTPTEFQTVKYAGTDGDGNAFSYDIVIK